MIDPDEANRAYRAAHAIAGFQLADIAFDLAGHHHLMDQVEQFVNFALVFAFDAFRQQRRRGFRNTAAVAYETDVLDDLIVHGQIELQLVAAKWIVPLRRAGRVGHLMKIARLLAMVENDLLIEIVQIVKHWKDWGKPNDE